MKTISSMIHGATAARAGALAAALALAGCGGDEEPRPPTFTDIGGSLGDSGNRGGGEGGAFLDRLPESDASRLPDGALPDNGRGDGSDFGDDAGAANDLGLGSMDGGGNRNDLGGNFPADNGANPAGDGGNARGDGDGVGPADNGAVVGPADNGAVVGPADNGAVVGPADVGR